MLLSKCAVYSMKKSRFRQKQNSNRLLSSSGFKTPPDKASLLDGILFWIQDFLLV